MFKEPSSERHFAPEAPLITQTHIDEVIIGDIARLECLEGVEKDESKLYQLCDQAIFHYVKKRFDVDQAKIRKTFGAYIVPVSEKHNLRLSVHEMYSTLDQSSQTANLTISFSLLIDGNQSEAHDSVTFTASPSCVQSLLQKIKERDAEEERKKQEEWAALNRLLPGAIRFAQQHPVILLDTSACEPITEFIHTCLGGALVPGEKLQMIRRDNDDLEPAWEFIRYRNGDVWDIRQFPERQTKIPAV